LAREALKGRFDVLISDIELPDGSGLDLMRELRGRVPGIAISGFGTSEDVQQSLEAGFALHLTKPIEANRLESAILEATSSLTRERSPA
jgi:CheY-like chemotaxis protein